MVEMRWLEKTKVLMESPDGERLVETCEAVLQYRYFVGPINEKTLLTEFHGWSGWIDVPTVTEG